MRSSVLNLTVGTCSGRKEIGTAQVRIDLPVIHIEAGMGIHDVVSPKAPCDWFGSVWLTNPPD